MKRQEFYIGHRFWIASMLCLSALIMVSACGCIKNVSYEKSTPSGINLITMDSIARVTLGDSTAFILMNPKHVSLYTLSPLSRPGDKDFTIGNYKVSEMGKKIPLDYYSILLFQLADSNNYDRGENVQSIRFMPSQAISVSSERDSVSLLFSFASMEIGVVHDGEIDTIFRYNNQRPHLLFFNRILHSETIDNLLNTLQQ